MRTAGSGWPLVARSNNPVLREGLRAAPCSSRRARRTARAAGPAPTAGTGRARGRGAAARGSRVLDVGGSLADVRQGRRSRVRPSVRALAASVRRGCAGLGPGRPARGRRVRVGGDLSDVRWPGFPRPSLGSGRALGWWRRRRSGRRARSLERGSAPGAAAAEAAPRRVGVGGWRRPLGEEASTARGRPAASPAIGAVPRCEEAIGAAGGGRALRSRRGRSRPGARRIAGAASSRPRKRAMSVSRTAPAESTPHNGRRTGAVSS